MKKKLMVVLFVLCIVFSSFGYTFARASANEDIVITLEEYCLEIETIFAKYNIRCGLVDYDNEVVITKGILKDSIENIESLLKPLDYDASKQAFTYEVTLLTEDLRGIATRTMPVKHYYSGSKTITAGLGIANIGYYVEATENAQNGQWMSIDKYSTSMNWGVMATNWTQTSAYPFIPSSRQVIYVDFYGDLTVQWTDPIVGITFTTVSSHHIPFAAML